MAAEDPALERHIGRVFPTQAERFALEEPVRALLSSLGFGMVQRLIDAEASAVSRPMDAAMTPLETAEYAARHGRLGGLQAFRRGAEAIVSAVQEERHELEARDVEAGEAEAEEVGAHG